MNTLPPAYFHQQRRAIGKFASWSVFFLALVYAVTTALGLFSLKSPQDPIGDPYFTIMEVLILMMAPFMVITFAAIHSYARPEHKIFSLTAVGFMLLLAGLTSCIHFVILTVSRPIAASGLSWAPQIFSFKWPSVVYSLDILAWDVIFPLAFLCAAPLFRSGKIERAIRFLMIGSAILCIAGLIGIPLADMSYRNIGILGYGVLAPVVFLLLGFLF